MSARPCLAGDCGCDAGADSEFCAFHEMMDAEVDAFAHVPLNKEGKWDGFGSMQPEIRQKDERGAQVSELLETMPYEKSASYAKRSSKYAVFLEAATRSRAVALPLPRGEEPERFRNRLSGILRQNKLTHNGRWSVVVRAGLVEIRRLGEFETFNSKITPPRAPAREPEPT